MKRKLSPQEEFDARRADERIGELGCVGFGIVSAAIFVPMQPWRLVATAGPEFGLGLALFMSVIMVAAMAGAMVLGGFSLLCLLVDAHRFIALKRLEIARMDREIELARYAHEERLEGASPSSTAIVKVDVKRLDDDEERP